MAVDFSRLRALSPAELLEEAKSLGVADADKLRRGDLLFAVVEEEGRRRNVSYGMGVLEVHGEGFGFLRAATDDFLPGAHDIYVSQSQIRRFTLQTGDTVIGIVRAPKEGERYPALLRVEAVNGKGSGSRRESFSDLSPIHPDDRVPLDATPALRMVDLVAPLGLGQRGMLVGPTRTGRAELLRHLARAFQADEELAVTAFLVGGRPEEIHAWRSETQVEVIATPCDEPASRHVQVAEIVFERARRMVEQGDDVVLLVDSLSTLLRHCAAELPGSGREIGGVDVAALQRLRRYLSAARALAEGGTLTVIGVVSGDRDSRTDQVLVEDLRAVANWECVLDRRIADHGVHPPIDIGRSGTRYAERLLEPDELAARAELRSRLTGDAVEDALLVLGMAAAPSRLDSVAGSGH